MRRRLATVWVLGLLAACEPTFDSRDLSEPRDLPTPEDAASADVPGDDLSFPDPGPLPEGNFAAPEGVALADRYAVVANSAFHYDGQRMVFGTGFLTVVDRKTRQVVQRIALPCRNPQEVSWDGAHLWALCSGETSFDGALVRPAGGAGLVGLDLSGAPLRIVSFLPIPPSTAHPLAGYPSSMVLRDRRAYLGCGTTAALLVADLLQGRMQRSPEDPLPLASLGLGDLETQDTVKVLAGPGETLLAGSFNRDRVLAFTLAGDEPVPLRSLEVGAAGMMDGVLDLAWRPGGTPELYVLLGLAQRVVAVSDLLGNPRLDDRFAVTGTMPNRLLIDGDRLWVLDSGDNRVRAVDADTGEDLEIRATMPPGTNPYGMAVGEWEGRRELHVTGLRSNSLWVFDARTGDPLAEVGPDPGP